MDFKPHKINIEEYRERSLSTTKEQVKLLKASKEYGRWEGSQSRLRFWSAWVPQISFVEVFILLATAGLIIGVCHVKNVLEVKLVFAHSHCNTDSSWQCQYLSILSQCSPYAL